MSDDKCKCQKRTKRLSMTARGDLVCSDCLKLVQRNYGCPPHSDDPRITVVS